MLAGCWVLIGTGNARPFLLIPVLTGVQGMTVAISIVVWVLVA